VTLQNLQASHPLDVLLSLTSRACQTPCLLVANTTNVGVRRPTVLKVLVDEAVAVDLVVEGVQPGQGIGSQVAGIGVTSEAPAAGAAILEIAVHDQVRLGEFLRCL